MANKERIKNRALKVETLLAYSTTGILQCNNVLENGESCPTTDVRALSLEHVNDDGADHRMALVGPRGGRPFYKALKDRGFPRDVELIVMCANCQFIKAYENHHVLKKFKSARKIRDKLSGGFHTIKTPALKHYLCTLVTNILNPQPLIASPIRQGALSMTVGISS